MKKILITLLFTVLSIGLMAQENHPKGIYVGKKTSTPAGSNIDKIDSMTIVANTVHFYKGVTDLSLGSGSTDTTSLSTRIDAVNDRADSLVTVLSDSIDLNTVYPALADTIPLATFGAGTGLIADTALFNNNVLIGSFYNEGSDTLVITQLMGVMKEGTGTETISVQFSWHATFLSGSATSLNAAALEITSMTTGTADVSFANAKIPPNVFVWGILSGASANNKPTFLSVTLSGYKIPGY
jgi:hypothetical protein